MTATPASTTPKPADLTQHLEKVFKPNEHLRAEQRFSPIKLIDQFNFGSARGGKQPAFVVARRDKPGVSTQPAAAFLANHVEVKE